MAILFIAEKVRNDGQGACPPTDAWQSFVRDSGYELHQLVSQPLGAAAIILIIGLVVWAASYRFFDPRFRHHLYTMTMVALSAGLATVALSPRTTFQSASMLALSVYIGLGGILAWLYPRTPVPSPSSGGNKQ